MKSVSVSTPEVQNSNKLYTAEQPNKKNSTLVICGFCGAQEQSVGDNKTECPNCDEYIY